MALINRNPLVLIPPPALLVGPCKTTTATASTSPRTEIAEPVVLAISKETAAPRSSEVSLAPDGEPGDTELEQQQQPQQGPATFSQ